MDVAELTSLVEGLRASGWPRNPEPDAPSLFDERFFADFTDEALCEVARILIVDCYPRMRSVSFERDLVEFLGHVSGDLELWVAPERDADDQLCASIAAAIDSTIGGSCELQAIGNQPAAFLLHALDILLRRLACGLAMRDEDPDRTLRFALMARSHDIAQVYDLVKANSTCYAAIVFRQLDAQLESEVRPSGAHIETIGDRLACVRHSVSHTAVETPAREMHFYALLIAIIAYGSNALEP